MANAEHDDPSARRASRRARAPRDGRAARAAGILLGAAILGACAAVLIACGGTIESWGDPRILVRSDGSIGVIANRRFSVFHGGSGPAHESRCMRSPSGAWSCARLDALDRVASIGGSGAHQWLRTSADREYLVFGGSEGPEVWTSLDGVAWTEVPPARATDWREGVGSAWITSDDALHVLVGDEQWVIRDTAVEQTLPWPVRCSSSIGQLCMYTPFDDVSGHVVKYYITPDNEPALELSTLSCDGTSCGVTSRVGPIWQTRGPEGRLLHRPDGTPTFVHRGGSLGGQSRVWVSTPDAQTVLPSTDVYHYDAVAMSDGRIALALATYARTLTLVLLDTEGATISLELATGDSGGVAVALAPQESGPDHVLVVSVDRDRGQLFEVTADLEVVLSEAVPLTR